MVKPNLNRYCPVCHLIEHSDIAKFCLMCGTELKSESLRDFYSSLKIPHDKISIEQQQKKYFGGFPFFLRKSNHSETFIEVVLVKEYPKCTKTTVEIKRNSDFKHGLLMQKTEDVVISKDYLNELVHSGFQWFHHSDMETLW